MSALFCPNHIRIAIGINSHQFRFCFSAHHVVNYTIGERVFWIYSIGLCDDGLSPVSKMRIGQETRKYRSVASVIFALNTVLRFKEVSMNHFDKRIYIYIYIKYIGRHLTK